MFDESRIIFVVTRILVRQQRYLLLIRRTDQYLGWTNNQVCMAADSTSLSSLLSCLEKS